MTRRRIAVSSRSGLTLLEVLLALAILAGAYAVLSQNVTTGLRAADDARSLTRAQLFAESTLAEMTSGAVAPGSQSGSVPDDPAWSFEVSLNPTETSGIVQLEIIVYKESELGISASYRLAKLMRDPSLEIPVDETETTEADATTTSTTETGDAS